MKNDNLQNAPMKRKWGKYYKADEVEGYFNSVMQTIGPERRELKALREKLDAVLQEKENHMDTAAELGKRAIMATEEADSKTQEILRLSEKLAKSQVDNARLSEQLAQQAVELARLQTKTDKLSELLTSVERQNPVEQMLETERKAKQILDKAKGEREEIIRVAYEKRSRMIAASRAAYYHALQFKQDMADHFHRMEEDVNASIDVLRQSESMRFALPQDEETPIRNVEQEYTP